MIIREFYPLTILADRWGCTVSDLLHLGSQDRLQICVNIYGMASGMRSSRIYLDNEDAEASIAQECEEEIEELAKLDAAFHSLPNRTTRDMPHGLFALDVDSTRFIDMPGGLPFELFHARKFNKGWWDVEFDPPVTIMQEHLCMLHEEVIRVEGIALEKPLATTERHTQYRSDELSYLIQASDRFWANADPDDKTTHPDNGTVAAWLEGKGYSSTRAKKAASIIRPEWASTGRKPEE